MLINADNYAWLATSPNEPDMLQEIHNLTPRFEKSLKTICQQQSEKVYFSLKL